MTPPIRTPADAVAFLRQLAGSPDESITHAALANAANALEAAIAATPPASPWQPMETAPRDGSLIDLSYPRLGRVCDCRWEDDFNLELYPNGCWVHETDNDGPATYLNNEPTHWMPIPPPPTQATTQEA